MTIQEFTIYPCIKLSSLINTLENGSRPSGGVGQISKGIPSIGGEHITESGKFDFDNIKYVPEKYFTSLTRGIIEKGDVLVVKDGATTGKSAFVDENFPFNLAAINEHIFIIRPETSLLLPEYLYYFLFSEWGQAQIEQEFHGGAIGGINQSFVEHLEIPLPPLPEQQRIVHIFRQLSLLEEWRLDTIHTSKKLHSKIFEWYFGNGESLDNQDVVTLESLLTTGLSSGYSPSTNNDLSGIPVYNLSALTDYGLDDQQLKYFPADSYSGKGSDLIVDDLLISRSNTLEFVGRVGRYKGLPSTVIYPDTMIRIRVDNHIDAIYLEHFLRSPYMRAVITQLARGTSGSMKKISQADINNFRVPMPSKVQKERFASTIDFLEEQEGKYLNAFQKHQVLFQLIASNIFTGKLTAAWRESHAEELERAIIERDEALDLRREKPSLVDFEEGRVTSEELEGLRIALGNFAVNLANYHSEMFDGVAQSFEEITKPLTQSLVNMSQNLITPFLESFRQSLQNIQLTLPEIRLPDENEINRQIDLLPLPQEKRAIHDVLDATSLRVLKLAHASPAYFAPDDLTFGAITSTHASASLRVLDSLGFVRLVEIDGVLRYHVIDANTDTALKPNQLQ
jgi:type I restriction enzyme, S subunit